MREEASDLCVREMGDVVHMTSAVSSKAVIQDRCHTSFWSQPRVTGAMNMMSAKNKPGKFRSPWKANQTLTGESNQLVANSSLELREHVHPT